MVAINAHSVSHHGVSGGWRYERAKTAQSVARPLNQAVPVVEDRIPLRWLGIHSLPEVDNGVFSSDARDPGVVAIHVQVIMKSLPEQFELTSGQETVPGAVT